MKPFQKIQNPKSFEQITSRLRAAGKSIGFVPTMGALHEGHLSLIRAARKENDVVIVSLFVNPAQFGPKEDFKKYPRTLKEDSRKLSCEKIDYLFCPGAKIFYPEGFSTYVTVGENSLAKGLCGQYRPGHFQGVATVVAKLFMVAHPSRVYFGAKDYQQAVIIKQLIHDLNMPIQFRLRPTVREKDGMAMSSRNRYLTDEQRTRAAAIPAVLFWARNQLKRSGQPILKIKRQAIAKLKHSVDRLQYFEVVDAKTLQPLKKKRYPIVVLTACYVGKTRLIDNVIITS